MFKAAQAQVETACLDYESKKELFKEDVISDYDLQTAKMHLLRLMPPWSRQKPERLTHATVCHIPKSKAPASGVVGTLPYKVGALVTDHHTTAYNSVGQHEYARLFLNERKPDAQSYEPVRNSGRDD